MIGSYVSDLVCARRVGKAMFAVVWISFVSFVHTGSGLNHQTRYERTRYVSSRNQIYGGNFDFNEKYIPFVHYWERPLQILESSMKIPKKLSSRPLFSWDIPVQISTYTPSKKTSATENSLRLVTKTIAPPKQRKPPDADAISLPYVQKTVQKSRSDRAKASAIYPDSLALIPIKKKKSGNRKKSIQEGEKWKEFDDRNKPAKPEGKLKRKKKINKNRKGKSEKIGRRRNNPSLQERVKVMNDQVNEVNSETSDLRLRNAILKERFSRPEVDRKPETVEVPCEMEKSCEHRCERVNGKAVCVCFRGFALEGDKCVDVNECETNNGDCNGRCINTIGSRKCICSAGFRLVDGSCSDINECLLRNGHGPCQDQCTNTLGGYYCSCDNLPGTSLSSDNHTCEKTGNCNPTSAGCSHSCISVSATTFCTCPHGMELGDDWKTCHDIDECSNPEDHDVRCQFGCLNTIGSYTCASENSTWTPRDDEAAE